MDRKLKYLIGGFCLLLCIYSINLPLHRTTNDFEGKNIILQNQIFTSNVDALVEYEDLYIRNKDTYVRKEILENVSMTKSVLNPQKRLFFIRMAVADKIPLTEETILSYISDLKYFGKYEEALNFAKSVNIDKTQCHNYKSTVLSITQCKIKRILSNNNYFNNYTVINSVENTSSIETFYNNPICQSSKISYEMLDLALNDIKSDKIESFRPCAFFKLGEYYMNKKNYKKAIEYYERFLKEINLNAEDAEYKLNEYMAKCYEKLGDKENSVKHKKILKELSEM